MKVAIFGKVFNQEFSDYINKIFQFFNSNDIEVLIYSKFNNYIKEQSHIVKTKHKTFNRLDQLVGIDFIISIGGDGTFLETIAFIKNSGIPVLGINSGRLGFLATVSKDEIEKSLRSLLNNDYNIEKRSLLNVQTIEGSGITNYSNALNELTVHKNDSSSMLTVHTFINDLYLNSFWADGLIISTPTGSTAYSLSAGGPILVPDTSNFIITPLAPHNLTVRPIIVNDENTIRLKIESRQATYMASLDYRSVILNKSVELVIKKADYEINIVKFAWLDYFKTLRDKLIWGGDVRN